MSGRLALTVTSVALSVTTAAPTYDVTKTVGDHRFMLSFRLNAQQVLGPPRDNVLSSWQKLPFPWTFFGREVTGYFVSDNGYITFDADATTSVAASTSLSAPGAPANSIFAFWTNLRMEAGQGQWTNSVWTATLGPPPDRVHLIHWMGVVPAGGTFRTTSFNFALALYENGEFEVIFTSGRKAKPVKATVGALSADRKTAVHAEGPAFDFPKVGFGGVDDLNYRFKPIDK